MIKVKGFGSCPTYGHWISLCGEVDPAKHFGFVYLVYCKKTDSTIWVKNSLTV